MQYTAHSQVHERPIQTLFVSSETREQYPQESVTSAQVCHSHPWLSLSPAFHEEGHHLEPLEELPRLSDDVHVVGRLHTLTDDEIHGHQNLFLHDSHICHLDRLYPVPDLHTGRGHDHVRRGVRGVRHGRVPHALKSGTSLPYNRFHVL